MKIKESEINVVFPIDLDKPFSLEEYREIMKEKEGQYGIS